MIDDTLLDCEERMTNSVEHAREELTTIRTGRANPAMFNGVLAEYYGTMTPITQMATISVPEPRMLLIKPYEMSAMGDIENAIRNSDLGVNPTNDGQVLRVTIPQLTEERRRDMVKLARSKGEDAKIAIRNVRRKGMEELKRIQRTARPARMRSRPQKKNWIRSPTSTWLRLMSLWPRRKRNSWTCNTFCPAALRVSSAFRHTWTWLTRRT